MLKRDGNRLVDDYLATRRAVREHFGYEPGWRELPLDDGRELAWALDGRGALVVGDSPEAVRAQLRYRAGEDLTDEESVDADTCSVSEVYTCRGTCGGVYRREALVLVLHDTHTDGNAFATVFSAAREVVA